MSQSPSGVRLLDAFVADVVADDYPQVSGRNARVGAAAAVLAAAIGLLVTVVLLQHLGSSEQRQATRADLTSRVEAAADQVERRTAHVADLRTAVGALAAELAANPLEQQRMTLLADQASLTPITGPGVVVTMDDAANAASGSSDRVLDRDIQDVVNALWEAGASGISVNGTRLTQFSAVRAAGEAILVDYVPLTRPYRIEAVGPATIDAATQGLLDRLSRNYGLQVSTATADVQLTAGDARTIRYATPVASGTREEGAGIR